MAIQLALFPGNSSSEAWYLPVRFRKYRTFLAKTKTWNQFGDQDQWFWIKTAECHRYILLNLDSVVPPSIVSFRLSSMPNPGNMDGTNQIY